MVKKVTDEIIKEILDKALGRQCVIWGICKTTNILIKRLEKEYGITDVVLVDSNYEQCARFGAKSTEILNGQSSKYYVVVPIAYRESIVQRLNNYGYTKEDYSYFCDCVVVDEEEYFEDAHGNRIIGKRSNLEVRFFGYNSVITLGKNFYAKEGCLIRVKGNDANISIGDNCYFDAEIDVESNGVVKVKKHANYTGRIYIYEGGTLIIDDYFNAASVGSFYINVYAFGKGFIGKRLRAYGIIKMRVLQNTEMKIGDDCMFSHDITFYTNDAHTIFDVNTGKNINSTIEFCKDRRIVLENHVWLGHHVNILYGAHIGEGSIIGTGALVKNKIPNNCIAVGIPARVIKTDVAWCYQNGAEDMRLCGDYVGFTQDNE